jgi:hypothetical protein
MSDRSGSIHPDILKVQQRRQGYVTTGDLQRDQQRELRTRQEPIIDPNDTLVYAPGLDLVPGFQKGDGTLTHALVSSRGIGRYLGRAAPRLTAIELGWRVTTIAATVTYAEVAIATSEDLDLYGGNTLTTLEAIDSTANVTGTGRRSSLFQNLGEVNFGAHLWAWFVVQATTPPILRGGLPNECGLMIEKSGSARPSVNTPSVMTESSTTTNDIWIAVRQVQST